MFRRVLQAYRQSSLTWLWLISYSDLMTNLMLFFLMSYALTVSGGLEDAARSLKEKTLGVKEKIKIEEKEVEVENLESTATRIIVGEDGVFDSGEAELKPDSIDILHKIAVSLKNTDNMIIVEGHTDNVPLRKGSKFSSNWELSAARAENVIRYLVHKEGFPPERLIIASYGEYRPVASNDTEEGRRKNRRIELVVLPIKNKTE